QSGKFDFTTDMNVTPERQEQVLFSEPTSHGGIVLAVRASDLEQGSDGDADTIVTLDALNGKRFGVETGTISAEITHKRLPDAKIDYFNTVADLTAALKAGKIDAFTADDAIIRVCAAEDDSLALVPELFREIEFGFAFPKTAEGTALQAEFNAFLARLKESGELERLEALWTGADDDAKTVPPLQTLSAENGTLTLATMSAYPPFEFRKGEQIVGFEIDLAYRFCEERGYGLAIEDMNFDSILASVQIGKCDFAAAGITITPERMESVLFSDPVYQGGTAACVLKESSGENGGFFASIRDSFEKTFIRENRWQLFLQGIGTTMLITVLSILFGTALGFAVFMLCRNGNPVANTVTRFCVWLVQGMPVVVLLMILYYIIFGSVNISGAAVSVVGFTLVFGSAVFAMLRSGVGAVDRGQTEAAYALGYSDRRAFFRVVLPQALPHFMPAYKGEITSLIKATAVVGYVAVQDLTKMGDIVRSRTYEAFFPLIAVAVIYFLLAAILTFLVRKIELRIDPKQRSRKDILKGVKTDD
ncbi:MAG: transporter substrate-binding domain-containing protein, partial [Clostridia bacterium]|nr:transporter substrate-binding domain-containing protein [Clostridia bacterium]